MTGITDRPVRVAVSARSAAPVLCARAATRRVGGRALVDGIDLDIHPGEVLAVVGPNGAGKSTLLALLAGDLPPQAGEVLLEGRRVDAWPAAALARTRALMPQQSVLPFAFTAEQVVALGRHPHGDSPATTRRLVARALEQAGVPHLATRAFPTLSGGEQALVTFARILAQDTAVLLLDEPTANLDVAHERHLLRCVRTAAADGRSVAVVMHDLNLAATYADRVAVLCDGRLECIGTPEQALTRGVLTRVFDHPIDVLPHPDGQGILVVAHR
ncbi:MAG: heme ABC transporter ATP-binding protein [Jiangellaceae bacterium]